MARDGQEVEIRREQLYYELGERSDKLAELGSDLGARVRDGRVRFADVEEVRGVLQEIGEAVEEADNLRESLETRSSSASGHEGTIS